MESPIFNCHLSTQHTKLAICDRKLAGFASQLFRRKKGIHGAGTETLQIKRNELEAQGFERSGECGSHSGIQSTRQLVSGYFDAHNLSVMAHTKLAEAEGTKCVFALLDRAESFPGNRTTVFDTRRKTCRG